MPSPIFLSRPAPGFSVAAVARGAQLTVVGAYRALQNPELLNHGYYHKAVAAIAVSLALELGLRLFTAIVRYLLYFFGASPSSINNVTWALGEVLLLRQLLITLLKDQEVMDDLFLQSLSFVDVTNVRKHPETKRLYGTLATLPPHEDSSTPSIQPSAARRQRRQALVRATVKKFAWRAGYMFVIWAASFLPAVGKLVFPVIAFLQFQKVVGTNAALGVFALGVLVPRHWMIVFLGAFFGSRSLMRDLLAPYFRRLPFTQSTKAVWFQNRQGILFGFGAGFYMLIRAPYAGVLVYGFASASAAYLLTKVSDPLPEEGLEHWTEEQSVWTRPFYD